MPRTSRAYGKAVRTVGALSFALVVCCGLAQAQTWSGPIQTPGFEIGGGVLLLTDGTVLMQEHQSSNWYILTPQKYTLDYAAGSIAATGSLPAGYAPTDFASAVLPDGRAIVEGGEYNYLGGKQVKDWTNLGAIYDPAAKTWTNVDPPGFGTANVWQQIGDAPSIVLADGTYMIGNVRINKAAKLDPTTLTWTLLTSSSGFRGKCDRNWEEGWTLLPDNDVLTIDTYTNFSTNGACKGKTDNSELYDPSAGSWSSGGSTVVQLYSPCGGHEIGPALLVPGGIVFATGANTCGVAGNTATYDTVTSTWSAGSVFPGSNDMADAPAALLPNGYVLVDTNPGWGKSPSTFYMFDGTKFDAISQPKSFPSTNTEGARMLILPSGQILVTQGGYAEYWIFNPPGTYQAAWQPQICAGCYPAIGYIGHKYKVSGTQFNGLSQGTLFGDEGQNATNYPVAVIANDATGHQFFARTSAFSTMGVATGGTMVSAKFEALPGTEGGDSTLTLITNGIPSNTVGICIGKAKCGK